MKLSKKSRYGIRAMLDLAVNAKEEHVALNHVAARNGISPQYLEQVFSALRKAEIVKSVKGPQGGYYFDKDLKDITMADILDALEGGYAFENEKAEEGEISTEGQILQEYVIDRVNRTLRELLTSITLEQLVEAYEHRLAEGVDMYYI